MPRRVPWAVVLGAGFVLLGGRAEAVVTKLTPLRELLDADQLIFTVKVDKLDPDKPSVVLKLDEDLKGKAPFHKLPVNLTADSEGQREQHTAKLLKRLEPDLPLVIFATRKGKRYLASGYTNGTWFQLIGYVEGDPPTVRWSFTHFEPYFRRTFKDSTEKLKEAIRDGLSGKKEPPAPNPKEKPGLGPEIKPKEKRPPKGGGGGPLLAVIPTFVIIAPLALLATLFPAIFGGLALLMRRWLVLLSIASLNSTLYLAHTWLHSYFKDTWWGSNLALWTTMALVTLVGVVWSWRRHRVDQQAAVEPPRRSEQILLWSVSLAGLGVVLYCLWRGTLFHPPWRELLAVWVVAWAGLLYLLYLRVRSRHPSLAQPKPAVEPIMLWALVFACAGLGASSLPRPAASEGVRVAWVFEPSEPGAFLSSPRIAGDRIYAAAIHGRGRLPFGVVYCLDRNSGECLWKFDDDENLQQVFSTPCLADGRLFIGEGLHENHGCKFYCLDAVTGRKLWDFETPSHTESSPCVAGDWVYFGAGDDGLYCFEAATGKPRWHFHEPLHIDANPAVAGTRLYAGSGVSQAHSDTQIFCLDTATGQIVWRKRMDLPSWGTPVPDGRHVFFGLGNGRYNSSAEKPAGALLCVEADTGRVVWRHEVPDAVLGKPAVDAEHVYLGARDGFCYCLDRDRGEFCWKRDLGSPVVTAPALIGRRLYVAASGGNVCCLQADTGATVWSFDVAAHSERVPQVFSSPEVVHEQGCEGEPRRIYFGAGLASSLHNSAALYCLEDACP
jgi:outer membrane protein assembly factor BamB